MVQHIHSAPRGGRAQQGVAEEPDDALAEHPCAGPWQCQLWPGHRRCRGCKHHKKGEERSVLKLQSMCRIIIVSILCEWTLPLVMLLFQKQGFVDLHPVYAEQVQCAWQACAALGGMSSGHAAPAMQIMYIGGIWGFSTQVQMWLNHAEPTKSDAVLFFSNLNPAIPAGTHYPLKLLLALHLA